MKPPRTAEEHKAPVAGHTAEPYLLEALQIADKVLEANGYGEGSPSRSQIRAAILAATGEQS